MLRTSDQSAGLVLALTEPLGPELSLCLTVCAIVRPVTKLLARYDNIDVRAVTPTARSRAASHDVHSLFGFTVTFLASLAQYIGCMLERSVRSSVGSQSVCTLVM